MHVVLLVVHQTEGRHRAGAQTQPALHTLLRCEGEFSLTQSLLKVVYCHRLLAVEDNQVVAVALMVAEEEVFAVLRAILMPILAGYLDGRSLGVFVHRVLYVVLGEKVKDLLKKYGITLHNDELYDSAYVYSAAMADYYGDKKSIPNEELLAKHIRDRIDDVDKPVGYLMNQWYADMCYAGIPIDWEEFT